MSRVLFGKRQTGVRSRPQAIASPSAASGRLLVHGHQLHPKQTDGDGAADPVQLPDGQSGRRRKEPLWRLRPSRCI
jgi:hypothetical protein